MFSYLQRLEIREYLLTLPIVIPRVGHSEIRKCRTNTERREVLRELLEHAAEDEMSIEDRTICLYALRNIERLTR